MLLGRAVVVVIVVAMIAAAVVGVLHGYVIALDEALAIVVAVSAVYGWVSKHPRVARVHSSLVLDVEACRFNAVVEALAAGLGELRWRRIPLSGVALCVVAIALLRAVLLRAILLRALLLRSRLLRAVLLGLETDSRECSQCNCQKWCGEINASQKGS